MKNTFFLALVGTLLMGLQTFAVDFSILKKAVKGELRSPLAWKEYLNKRDSTLINNLEEAVRDAPKGLSAVEKNGQGMARFFTDNKGQSGSIHIDYKIPGVDGTTRYSVFEIPESNLVPINTKISISDAGNGVLHLERGFETPIGAVGLMHEFRNPNNIKNQLLQRHAVLDRLSVDSAALKVSVERGQAGNELKLKILDKKTKIVSEGLITSKVNEDIISFDVNLTGTEITIRSLDGMEIKETIFSVVTSGAKNQAGSAQVTFKEKGWRFLSSQDIKNLGLNIRTYEINRRTSATSPARGIEIEDAIEKAAK